MKQKRTLKATLTGLGTSFLSFLGISCGACAGTCGIAVAAPVATLLGISAASMANRMTQLLPVFTALSAMAFTAAYFALYAKNGENTEENNPKKPWIKPLFWVGLLLTIGIYAYAITGTGHGSTCSANKKCHTACADKTQTSSCTTLKTKTQ